MQRSVLLVGVAVLLSSPKAVEGSEYLGAEQCKTCHETQYRKWRTTGHAIAQARLSQRQQRDRACLGCHTMDARSDDPALAGVQCEACHGKGTEYGPRFVMKDPVLSRLLGLKDISESTCLPCHTPDGPSMEPFNFEEAVKLVCYKEGGTTLKAGKKKQELDSDE